MPSRRAFLQLSAAAAALQIVTEPMLAAAARHPISKDAVMIDSNEKSARSPNPRVSHFRHHPAKAAAISTISPTNLSTPFAQQKASIRNTYVLFPVPLRAALHSGRLHVAAEELCYRDPVWKAE